MRQTQVGSLPVTEHSPELERFQKLLPFYVNGTVGSDDRNWMIDFLARHPERNAELAFTGKVQKILKTVGADRPADVGLRAILSEIRAEREPLPRLSRIKDMLTTSFRIPVPALAGLAIVVIVQGIVIGSLKQTSLVQDAETYRGAMVPPDADVAQLKVSFSPSASISTISDLLLHTRCRVITGPSETGEYWLAISDPKRIKETVAELRKNSVVDDVMVLGSRVTP